MIRWTLALTVGIIIACGGGQEARTVPLSSTSGDSAAQTSEDQGSAAPQLTPKTDTTRERGTAETDTSGLTPAATPPGAPTLDGSSQPEARSTPAVGTESPSGPVVILGGVAFQVELAVTSAERILGLSGHPPLAPDAGMLFVFEQAQKPSFWMKGMLFPLDMIWIDADCKVVHITRDAPPQAPDQSLSDLPRYGPPVPVLYVLEINAGQAESTAVTLGSPARFSGSLTGRYGC